jgi:AraC-like DNA-binding protein
LPKNKQPIEQHQLSSESQSGMLIHSMREMDKQLNHLSKPHRDDHFLLMVALKGSFHLKIDFEEVLLNGPFVLTIAPDQVHQLISVRDAEGWLLGIEEFILEKEFQYFIETKLSHPLLLINKEELADKIQTIFKLAFQLQQHTGTIYTEKSILFLIHALFCLLHNEVDTQSKKESTKEKRGYIIEQAFKQLLKKKYKEYKNPSQYAENLSVSVSHLNDTIKKITGLSVSTHIQLHNILQAKRLLYFTDLEMKEICYQLGYDDPVYFGKLFKKITKLTPLEFRKQFRD